MKSVIIFDYDGVLVDSNAFHKEALFKVSKKLKIPFTDAMHNKFFVGASLKEGSENYLSHIGKLDLLNNFIEGKRSYDAEYKSSTEVIPHSLEFVNQVKKTHTLAICSGARRILVDAYIEKFDLDGVFKSIVTADVVTKSKPDPESYIKVLRELNISQTEAISIEDSVSGIRSALAAGIFTVAITTTHDASELEIADRVVDNFSDILN